MKTIRKWTQAGVCMLISMFLITSCSDKDEPNPPASETQLEEVIKKLNEVEGVDDFVKALKSIGNVQEEKLTVFAAKNYSSTRSADGTLKRHIAKGANDIKSFSGDTLVLQTLSGEELYVIKTGDGGILVNGIALAQDNRITAGQSYIYVLANIIPETKVFLEPKYEIKFTVLECNRSWSPENNAETFPSDDAAIVLYKKNGNDYNPIDSIRTDAKGKAILKHSHTGELYYTVENGDMVMSYGGYMPVGVFTSQAEIDANGVMYRTNTFLDDLKPGSIKLADLNGDGLINEDDKLASEYFMVDKDDEVTAYVTGPMSSYVEENHYTLEDLKNIKVSLEGIFKEFISTHYVVDYKLTGAFVSYPTLNNFWEAEALWEKGYKYIQSYLYVTDRLNKQTSNRAELLKEWNTYACGAEFAYVYSVLVSSFGDVPLFTEPPTVEMLPDVIRNPKAEVMAYLESLIPNASATNAYPIRALLARYYANEKDYSKVAQHADNIIHSGSYGLVDSPLKTVSNKEVILGGYTATVVNDSVIPHPICYREVILLAAEAALKQGNQVKALEYTNQVQAISNEALYQNLTENDLYTVCMRESASQGMGYMLINRWGKLLEVLGQKGAEEYNKLLPIPRREIDYSPRITQNPGY